MVSQVRSLFIESWALYPFGVLLVAARIASRRLLLGSWKKLQIDDWIMVFVIVTFTGVIVSVNQVSQNLSNYLPPGVAETFTPEQKENAVYGSKFVLILEEFMLANTWLCKACLLILYHQMTLGLKQNKLVKLVAAYCVFGYVLTQILYLGVWCRPFKQYWQVPVDNSQCASYYHHLITASVFNISSDLIMLYIPLPILIRARLPLKRKIILCGVFSLGLLVGLTTVTSIQILSAILNRYYNFTAGYGSLIYLNWYVGEAATSVFVANVPHLWPLLSRLFSLGAFNTLRRNTGNNSSGGPGADSSSRNNFNKMKSSAQRSGRRQYPPSDGYLRTESEERIAGAGAGAWPLPTTPSDGAALEMGPLEAKGMGYMATAAGGGGHRGDDEKADMKDGIVRTVQIRQYSS